MPPHTRQQWTTPDDDLLTAVRVRGHATAPRLVVFHGLEGGVHSTYARSLLRAAAHRGWWADLVLWRTCDGNPVNRTRRAYHSGASDDALFALTRILEEDRHRPTVLLGVSLGGNVLLKMLGELGADAATQIRAAAGVSVPFDLARVYGRFFLDSLKAKTLAKLDRFPDLVDPARLRAASTLWQFDDAVTAPTHGFADAADYYARCSSMRFLDSVRVPALLLCAQNDPFVSAATLAQVAAIAERNTFLECTFPRGGGHVGFFAGPVPWRARAWMEDYTLDWLAAHAG